MPTVVIGALIIAVFALTVLYLRQRAKLEVESAKKEAQLEELKAARDKGQDLAAMIKDEIKHLEEDIALRSQYIQALLDKL